MRAFTHWRWHLDEMYVKIKGEMHYLWRAVDHEGEVLESFVTKKPDKAAANPCLLQAHGWKIAATSGRTLALPARRMIPSSPKRRSNSAAKRASHRF